MEITTGNKQKIMIDVPKIDEEEFNFLVKTSHLPNYNYVSLNPESRNFASIVFYTDPQNNKLAYRYTLAGCHEQVIQGYRKNESFALMLGCWGTNLLQKVTQRVVNVFALLNEENGWEELPDFSHIKRMGSDTYFIMIDFSGCMQYFDSLVKLQLILRLIRWSLVTEKESPNFKTILNNYENVETDDKALNNIKYMKNNLLYVFNHFDIASKIQIEDNLLFHDEESFNKQVRKLKNLKYYPLDLISRHPTHRPLRGMMVECPAVVRFGILKDEKKAVSTKDKKVINTFEAVQNSASKFKMKRCFEQQRVKTAEYCIPENEEQLKVFLDQYKKDDQKFIIKSEYGSRGVGLWLIENKEKAIEWFNGREMNGKRRLGNYIIERYYNYNKEYRLHVSKDGCFYTNRKMLKTDAEERWFRNDSNSVWIREENPKFEKPRNWNDIVRECVKALNAVGLDLGACDVRVQSKNDKPDFIICEINSAPSFGEITLTKYQNIIRKICADS